MRTLDSLKDDLLHMERAARALREAAAFMEWGSSYASPAIVVRFVTDDDGDRDFEVVFHSTYVEATSEAA